MSTSRKEEWRPIPGYEGAYEASDQGSIRSLDRVTDRGRRWRGRIMTLSTQTNGYRTVTLWRDGRQKTPLVHRLVLAAFAGEPLNPETEGRHLDGDQTNNSISNLAWGSHSDNQLDQVAHGTHFNGSKTHCPSGHPYSETNTYRLGAHRMCRTCRREYQRNYQRRLRASRRAAKEAAA